jgi:hypothetical protein
MSHRPRWLLHVWRPARIQDRCERALERYGGLATCLPWSNLDPLNQTADDLHDLGTRGLIRQQATQFLYFAPIELAEVRMDLEGWS